MQDQHPADDLAKTIMDTITGKGFTQTIRDAWDRHFGSAAPASDHEKAISDMNKQANDQRANDAMKTFIKPAAADAIRKKAMR